MNFFQLAGGYPVKPYLGVQCSVRVFPWTEEFVADNKVIHYFEYDDPTDDAFVRARIKVWTALFKARESSAAGQAGL